MSPLAELRPTALRPVVLATAATSADPWRARLVAIAAARPRVGQAAVFFESCFNPRARVPAFVCTAIGRSQLDLEAEPLFAEQVEALLEFLGRAPLAGIEVLVQVERLGHELSRLQRPGLTNPLIDLGQLAERLGLVNGKPSLPALVAALGLSHPHPYRPTADVRVALRLTDLLLRLAEARGWSAGDTLYQPPLTGPGVLDRPDPAPAPDGPGVYLLRGADGQVLYVGQARSLRRRLAAYHRRQLALLRRLEGLVEAAADIELLPTTSELEAMVLEARLIALHRPRFNTQQRTRPTRLFLRADLSVESASLGLSPSRADDGARYIGPFRTSSGAAEALALLRALLPGLAGRARRQAARRHPQVKAALRFLDGERAEIFDRLQQEQRTLAGRGERTALQASLELLRRAVSFELDLAPTELASPPLELLVLSPGRDGRLVVHLLRDGLLVACYEANSRAGARSKARAALAAPAPPTTEATLVERALVTRWLHRLGPEHHLEPLSVGSAER